MTSKRKLVKPTHFADAAALLRRLGLASEAEWAEMRTPLTRRLLAWAAAALEDASGEAPGSRPAATGAPWTRAEEAMLVKAFEDGVDLPAIARRHRRSAAAVELRLVALGKIARDVCRFAKAVSPAIARHGEPWTAEEDRQLIAQIASITDARALARLHGRTKSAIEARLIHLGRMRPEDARHFVPNG